VDPLNEVYLEPRAPHELRDATGGGVFLSSQGKTALETPSMRITYVDGNGAPFPVLSIDSDKPVSHSEYGHAIEKEVAVTTKKHLPLLKPGNVPNTYADVISLDSAVGDRSGSSVRDVVAQFMRWDSEFDGV